MNIQLIPKSDIIEVDDNFKGNNFDAVNNFEEIDDNLKALNVEMRLRGMSKQTSKIYLFYNVKFLEYIQKYPKDITEEDIKDFLAYKLSDDVMTNSSVALVKASLKFYYDEILGKNIHFIKTPRMVRKLPTILSKKEIKNILEKTENIKHKLLIELLYSTGLRLAECTNLRYDDLDLNENIGWVRKGKGSKDRIFIISEIFKRDLIDYMRIKGNKKGYIFTVNGRKMSARGVQHAIKISAERAGIKKNVHVHTL